MMALIITFTMLVIVVAASYSTRMNLLIAKSLKIQTSAINTIANQQRESLFQQTDFIDKLINPNLFIGKNGFSSTNCISVETISNKKYCVIASNNINNYIYEIMIDTVKPTLFDPKGFSSKGYFKYNFLQIVKKGSDILLKKNIVYNTPPINSYEDSIFIENDGDSTTQNLFAINVPLTDPMQFDLFKSGDSIKRLGGFVGILEVHDAQGLNQDWITIYNEKGENVAQSGVNYGTTIGFPQEGREDSADLPLNVKFGMYLQSSKWYMDILVYRGVNTKYSGFASSYNADKWMYYAYSIEVPVDGYIDHPYIYPTAFANQEGNYILDATFVKKSGYDYPIMTVITQPQWSSSSIDIHLFDCQKKGVIENKQCFIETLGSTSNTELDLTNRTNIENYIDDINLKTYSRYSEEDQDFITDTVAFEYAKQRPYKSLIMNIFSLNSTPYNQNKQNLSDELDLNRISTSNNLVNMYFLQDYNAFSLLIDKDATYQKQIGIFDYSPNSSYSSASKILFNTLGDKQTIPAGLKTEKNYFLYNYYLAVKNNYTMYAYDLKSDTTPKQLGVNTNDYPNFSIIYENNKIYLKANALNCLLKRKSGYECKTLDITNKLDLPIGVISSNIIS